MEFFTEIILPAALELIQPITEMTASIFPGGQGRQVRRADLRVPIVSILGASTSWNTQDLSRLVIHTKFHFSSSGNVFFRDISSNN